MYSKIIAICILLITSINIFASVKQNSSPLFGPEWTFTNNKILSKEVDQFGYLQLIQQVLERKSRVYENIVSIKNYGGAILVTFKDDSTVEIKPDPGVVEVKASKRSEETWREQADFFQDFIFDTMREVGLAPHDIEGAGHVNIGLDYFAERPGLDRKFIIDYLSHQGVGVVLNSLLANNGNGTTVGDALFPADYIYWHYQEAKDREDKDQEAKEREAKDREQKIHAARKNFIESLQYLSLEDGVMQRRDEGSALWYLQQKLVAIGLRGIADFHSPENEMRISHNEIARFEMRQVRPQKSMADFLKVLKIYSARLKYLEKVEVRLEANKIFSNIDDGWVALGQFADYLEEANLKYEDFLDLVPEVWRELPKKYFVRKKKIKKAQRPVMCRKLTGK